MLEREMNENQKRIAAYYESIESRLGYDYLLGGAKHLGYCPDLAGDITDKQARILQQDLVAKNLDLRPGQVVLDAGCGQGIVSIYLAKKCGVKIYGIAITPFEINKARKLAVKLGVSDIVDYQLMDYSKTSFPNNFFDAIYTTEALSHSPDIKKTLSEFLRILKPDGKMALFEYTMAPDEQFNKWEKRMVNVVIEGSAMLGLRDFRHDRFIDIIKKSGLIEVKEQNITQNVIPSFYRLHKFFYLPYILLVRPLRLQKIFINATAAYEFYKMALRGLFRYLIFTAKKPNS